MRLRLPFCAAMTLLPLMLAAPTVAVAGLTYSVEQIRAFTLADLRLGMTQAEVEKILEAAGYEGKFPAEVEEAGGVKPWRTVDRAVFVSRYLDNAGVVRVWRIRFGQAFDVPMSTEALKARVVAKYGEATEPRNSGRGGDVYHIPFAVNHEMGTVCTAGDDPTCWNTMAIGGKLTPKQVEDTFMAEARAPTLEVEYQSKALYLTLTDHGTHLDAVAAAKAKAAAKTEDRAKAAAKSVELGF